MRKLWHWIWAANPLVVDGIIASIIVILSLGGLLTDDNDPSAVRDADLFAVLLVLVGGGAITFRRTDPLRVLAATAGSMWVFSAFGYSPDGEPTLALMIAAYTVVTRADARWLPHAAAASLPMVPLSLLHESGSYFGSAVTNTVAVAVVAIIGHNVRLRREKRAQEARTEVAEAERAVSDERLRIARELHDVVAHAMSIVAVQAGVAAHIIDEQPDEAKRMLENVRITSHEALDEMRRLLGVLRGGDAALAPAPGLADVGDLVASMRESGVPTDLRVGGAPDAVPAGVDLSAYRIVQEALTNVLKHAGAASATVDIQYVRGLVIIEVADDGRGASVATTGGHGLLGMRERVAVYGGELLTGPKAGGGYRVRATLPYESEPSQPPVPRA